MFVFESLIPPDLARLIGIAFQFLSFGMGASYFKSGTGPLAASKAEAIFAAASEDICTRMKLSCCASECSFDLLFLPFPHCLCCQCLHF